MLIKNIDVVDRLREFKNGIYWLVTQLSAGMQFSTVGLIHIFVIHIFIALIFVSCYFKTHDYFPPSVSNIFRIFLLTNLSKSFSVDASVVYVASLGTNLLIFFLIVFHYLFDSVFTICTRVLSLATKLTHYFIVPVLDLAVNGYLDLVNPTTATGISVLGGLTAFTTLVPVIVLCVETKLEIRMLRKNVTLWNLDNDIHFYGTIYLIFKSVVIGLQGASVPLCLTSLFVWYYHRKMYGGMVGKGQKVMEYSFYNYIAATDAGVLVTLVTDNPMLGFSVWIVLLGSFIFHCLVTIYRHRTQKRLPLPNCESGPEQFYHFYYRLKEQFKGEDAQSGNASKGKYQKIYSLHRISCDIKKCQLRNVDQDEDMEQVVGRIIQSKKHLSMDNRLVFQLWNLQLGKKCSVQVLADKPATCKQDFIIYSIEKMTKDSEVTIKNRQSNKTVITKIFYDLIYEVSTYYSQFYEQLSLTHPKIDALVRLGTSIKTKIDTLKVVYSELLKSKLINFKMIELYMQFLTNFVSQNALDKDDISRLMKAQQTIYFQDISENYLPTIALYLQSGSIENANAEAQRFLQATRFELKYKSISDITFPCLSIEKMKQIVSKEVLDTRDDPIYSFFKKSQREYGFGTLIFSERTIRQKKLMVVQILQQNYSDQKNLFLVDKDFDMKLMQKKVVKIKSGGFRSAPLTMNWQDTFDNYILPNKDKIMNNKMMKIPTSSKECILVVKRLRCIPGEQYILEAQIFVSSQLTKRNRSSIMTFRKSMESVKFKGLFQFHVTEEDSSKLTFYGLRGDNPLGKAATYRSNTLTAYQKQIHIQFVQGVMGSSQRPYDKDIKTYRLFDGQLYNVDLEDKQAYNALFEQHISQSKRIEPEDNSSFECYIFIGVMLLGFGLIAFSVVLIVQFQSGASSISTLYSQFINIESLKIDFQRINSLLRDLASGFSSNFPAISIPKEIGDSYGRIQKLKNQVLFTNDEYTINFQHLAITGSLMELVDVILAHITEVLGGGDLSVIEDIHDTCINQLNTMIQTAQAGIYADVLRQINSATTLSSAMLYSSLLIVALLYVLMGWYCLRSNTQLKDNLAHLLYISDSEAHLNQQNAEKMKYAVQMIRKNFEVDTQNLLITESDFKRRKNPKEAIQSQQIFYTITTIALIALTLHVVCLVVFSSQFGTQLAAFQTMKVEAISTTSIYHLSVELATYIEHVGSIDDGIFNQLRSNLSYIQYQMSSFQFSDGLNNFINTLFFYDSCPLVKNMLNITSKDCANSTPGFTITNPFQIGIAIYINRQNYYLFNNLTQNFAHTGVYSRPFAEILTNLTTFIKTESLQKISQIQGTLNLMNGLIIAIDSGYILAFIAIYYYFKNQLYLIKDILRFFNEKLKARKLNSEEKDEQNSSQASSGPEDYIEEEKVPLDEVKTKHKRRTTIQQNEMLLTG